MTGMTWCLAPQEFPQHEHMRAHGLLPKGKRRGYRPKRHGAARAKFIGPVTRL